MITASPEVLPIAEKIKNLIINNIFKAVPRGGSAAAGGEGQSGRLQHVLLPHVSQARYGTIKQLFAVCAYLTLLRCCGSALVSVLIRIQIFD